MNIRRFSVFAVLSAVVLSCGSKRESAEDPVVVAPPRQSDAQGLSRLTPEQISTHFENAIGFRLHHAANGYDFDLIKDYLGISLGGVDFKGAFRRDPIPKVQTLLVVRTLALLSSIEIVVREYEKRIPESEFLFKEASMIFDRPLAAGEALNDEKAASEARWTKQLQFFYWKLYTRPPTQSEIANIKIVFVGMAKIQNNVAFAWVGTLYAMMSAIEFWYTTR